MTPDPASRLAPTSTRCDAAENPGPVGAPATASADPATAGAPTHDDLTTDAVQRLLSSGDAVPLAEHVTDYVRYDGAWWTADRDSWIRITDPALQAVLDRYHRRMARGLFA